MTIGEYISYLGASQQITPLQVTKCLQEIEDLNKKPDEKDLNRLQKILKIK